MYSGKKFRAGVCAGEMENGYVCRQMDEMDCGGLLPGFAGGMRYREEGGRSFRGGKTCCGADAARGRRQGGIV